MKNAISLQSLLKIATGLLIILSIYISWLTYHRQAGLSDILSYISLMVSIFTLMLGFLLFDRYGLKNEPKKEESALVIEYLRAWGRLKKILSDGKSAYSIGMNHQSRDRLKDLFKDNLQQKL